MILFLVMVLTEVLTPIVLRQHFYKKSKPRYFIFLVFHIILSLWLWMLFFELHLFRGFWDSPGHIWMLLNMNGMIIAVVAPRFLLITFHFTGALVRIKTAGHIRGLTNTALGIFFVLFSAVALGTFFGRFHFRTENVTIRIKGLSKDLDGLKIVQISDLHLAGYFHHKKLLRDVIDKVNSYKPDLLLNTGDFVSYGWREFDKSDIILSKGKSNFGNFAVMGNHDFGTYHPDFTEADRVNNVLIMKKLIESSGYRLLNDENTKVKIRNATIGIIGVITKGRHPDIIHGDLGKALSGLDSVDLRILLSHDPNHWQMAVAGKTDIELTLSGHTHGMQLGIFADKIRWSPSKYFYPHWGGLYSTGNQFQYVNIGLGVLSIPFRIWMPPEITVITLRPEQVITPVAHY